MRDIHQNLNTITDCIYQLRDIAAPLARIGNTQLAKEISDVAIEIERQAEAIRQEDMRDSQERFQQVQENSANLFRAVLAGAELERREQSR